MWYVYTVKTFEFEEVNFRVMNFICWLRNIELYELYGDENITFEYLGKIYL